VRFPDHGVAVVWVGPWPGLISFTQASWGPVKPNATELPSKTYTQRASARHIVGLDPREGVKLTRATLLIW